MNKLLALALISLLLLGCITTKADKAMASFEKLPEYQSFERKNPNSAVGAVFLSRLKMSEVPETPNGDCRDDLFAKEYYEISAKTGKKELKAFIDYDSSKVECVVEQKVSAEENVEPSTEATEIPPEATVEPTATPTAVPTAAPTAEPTPEPTATPTPEPTPTPYNPFVCSDGTTAGECSKVTKPYFCAPENPPTLIKLEVKCS
ncbi:MAG: hypothetical protein ACE5DI_06055 [Candidatus Micrarchaeia archaeon]